jgi:hypothetical protein
MEQNEKNKIIEIRVTYEEWIKNPFPQKHALQLDTTTKYVVTNCPPEYAKHLESIGIAFELPKESVTITFYPKVKLNGTDSKMKLTNLNSGNKIIIFPKCIGITKDVFCFDGKVKVIRIFSSNEFMTAKYIKIGNKKLDCIIGFTQPSKVQDFIFNCEFKIGDNFELSTDIEIQKIELLLETE